MPVVKIANVKDGFVNLDGCSFVNETVARNAAIFELCTGDILISMTGYIGEIARVRNEGRMLLNQRVGKFSVKDADRLDSDYLFYCLRKPMHLQLITLTKHVENLRRTRDLLLPRLLSGQIPVEAEAA